jgi:hypothetical protein
MLKSSEKYQMKVKESICKYASDIHPKPNSSQATVLNEDVLEEVSQQS